MNDQDTLRERVRQLEARLVETAKAAYIRGRRDERRIMAHVPHDAPAELVHALRSRQGHDQPVNFDVHGRHVTAVLGPVEDRDSDVAEVWEAIEEAVEESA